MQGSPSNDICQSLKEWYERVPSVSMLAMYLLIAGYFLCWTSFPLYLVNDPEAVIFSGQVWRLVTASFISTMLLQLIFTLFMYLPTACDTERRMGSVKYLMYFLCNCEPYSGFIVQLLYTGLIYVLAYLEVTGLATESGLWGVIMLEIVVRCNRDPEAAVQ